METTRWNPTVFSGGSLLAYVTPKSLQVVNLYNDQCLTGDTKGRMSLKVQCVEFSDI